MRTAGTASSGSGRDHTGPQRSCCTHLQLLARIFRWHTQSMMWHRSLLILSQQDSLRIAHHCSFDLLRMAPYSTLPVRRYQ